MTTTLAPPHSLGELSHHKAWCVWKLEQRDGKLTKIPYSPVTNDHARTNDPRTFAARHEADRALAAGAYAGIGFLVHNDLGLTFIDLDHVVASPGDPLPDTIAELIADAETYAEWSPSGTGVHLFFAGTMGSREHRNGGRALCRAEAYSHARFATFTEDQVRGTPNTFNPDRDTLTAILDRLDFRHKGARRSGNGSRPRDSGGFENDRLLERAFRSKHGERIRCLYDGDTGDYPSASEADLALVSYLAFWTQEREQLADLWRCSGLYRSKMDREDYVIRTLDRALDGYQGTTYDPNRNGGGPGLHVNGNSDYSDESGAGGSGSDSSPAPMFPVRIFPPALDTYAVAAARSIGVPVEMVAVPLLVFAGGTIGNAVRISLKRGFVQLPTLWAGVIADPGSAKSPAQQHAQWPINQLQKDAYDQYQKDLANYEADLERWKAKPANERGDKPIAPKLEHLYSTDPTLEALVDILSRCRGVSVSRDELSGFISAMDKYRQKGSDRQEYTSLWAHAPIKADRRTGGTAYATHPVAGVYGGIQPDLAGKLHNDNGDRDGMVERFLLFRPDVRPARWTDDDLDPALLEPVADLFATLRNIHIRDVAHLEKAEAITVHLHPDARSVWIDWYNHNADETEAASGLRRGFCSKLSNQVARIALVLHCLHHADDPRVMVSEVTMRHAIAVGEFFRSHLDRVVPLLSKPSRGEPANLAARIFRYLRNPDLQRDDGWVRRGVLLHKLSNVSAVDLADELANLQRRGVVESRTVTSETKPAEEWRICRTSSSEGSEQSELFRHERRGSSDTSHSSNGYASHTNGEEVKI